MNVRHMIAQPATDYYAWQVEVQLDNFLSMGISDNSIDVVCSYEDTIPESWIKLNRRFYNVRFFYYPDTREDKTYAPSIQAHILAKHWKVHSYLSKEAVFFVDCDFVYTKRFNFHKFLNDDTWYFSNCNSYIGYDYIVNKSEVLFEMMCDTVDICSCKIKKSNKDKGGGAQKLMKNVTASYWEKVEKDSLALFKLLSSKKAQEMKRDDDPNPIQAWTASMWAELWNAWRLDHTVELPEEFDFAWATCVIDKWDQVSFFHNAGVISSEDKMFYKGDYTDRLPYDDILEIDKTRCSSMYYEAVQKSSETSCLK
jgi:hypothetical protein